MAFVSPQKKSLRLALVFVLLPKKGRFAKYHPLGYASTKQLSPFVIPGKIGIVCSTWNNQ